MIYRKQEARSSLIVMHCILRMLVTRTKSGIEQSVVCKLKMFEESTNKSTRWVSSKALNVV